MKKLVLLLLSFVVVSWSIPKPMESIEKYNVMLVHGAYESGKGIAESNEYLSAYADTKFLGKATLGEYDNNGA